MFEPFGPWDLVHKYLLPGWWVIPVYTSIMGWISAIAWWKRMLPKAWLHTSRFAEYAERGWWSWVDQRIDRLSALGRSIALLFAAIPLLTLTPATVGFWYFIAAVAQAHGDVTEASFVPDTYLMLYTLYIIIGIVTTARAAANDGLDASFISALKASIPVWLFATLYGLSYLLPVLSVTLFRMFGPDGTTVGGFTIEVLRNWALMALAPVVTFWVAGSSLAAGAIVLKSGARSTS